MKYLSNRSWLTLGIGLTLAACAAEADEDGASASAPGVGAQAGANGVSASAPGVSAQAGPNGASAQAGPVGVQTAQLALDELSGNVDVSVDGFKTGAGTAAVPPPPGTGAAPVDGAPGEAGANAARQLNVACAAGGDAALDGYVNVVPAPVAVDVKVAIGFNNCTTQTGTTIDGDIDFSQTVLTGPETPLQVETIYTGDVSLTGERVNVSCPVDLNVVVDETGRAVKVAGMFCNEDASQLNLQIQPRWAL
jgi:hypothetical protein